MANKTKTTEDVERRRADYLAHGYQEIEEIRGIRVGSRVRHRGEQYPEAIEHGTAIVVGIFEHVDSPWSRKYAARDVELIVERDRPVYEGGSPYGFWADYHTAAVSS